MALRNAPDPFFFVRRNALLVAHHASPQMSFSESDGIKSSFGEG
jgi:hypothetical protein